MAGLNISKSKVNKEEIKEEIKEEKKENFWKQIIISHSGVSSKRICGVFGFLIVIAALIYCTLNCIQAPDMIEPFMYAICLLLGIYSVTGIWRKNDGNS